MLLSKGGREYKALVSKEWWLGRFQSFGRREVSARIDVFMPDKRRRDVHNLHKIVLDALQAAGAFDDDSQVIDLRIRKAGIDRLNPRIEIAMEAA